MLKVFESIDAISVATADYVVEKSAEAIKTQGKFTIALAGGSTPKKLYQLLATDKYKDLVDWPGWEVFFSDERFVPLDDENSNYQLAYSNLLSSVPIPTEQVHAVATDSATVEEAAEKYNEEVRRALGENPQFDLVLLGLGSDGHTASLFPGKPALGEIEKFVVSSGPGVLPPPVDRITFTFPLINASKNVLFLTAGPDKAQMVKASLDSNETPASKVKPTAGNLDWFVDEAAASQLSAS